MRLWRGPVAHDSRPIFGRGPGSGRWPLERCAGRMSRSGGCGEARDCLPGWDGTASGQLVVLDVIGEVPVSPGRWMRGRSFGVGPQTGEGRRSRHQDLHEKKEPRQPCLAGAPAETIARSRAKSTEQPHATRMPPLRPSRRSTRRASGSPPRLKDNKTRPSQPWAGYGSGWAASVMSIPLLQGEE